LFQFYIAVQLVTDDAMVLALISYIASYTFWVGKLVPVLAWVDGSVPPIQLSHVFHMICSTGVISTQYFITYFIFISIRSM